MDIIGWIIVGALAGWIGSLLTGNNRRMGLVANLVVGIIGPHQVDLQPGRRGC